MTQREDNIALETMIVSSLLHTPEFFKKTAPHLKELYFKDERLKTIFSSIHGYYTEHGSCPSPDVVKIIIDDSPASQETHDESIALLETITRGVKPNAVDWLVDRTEKFAKDAEIYHAIIDSLDILDDDTKPREIIEQRLREALKVSFDMSLGHDYVEDAEKRFDFYKRDDTRIPFKLSWLNKVTEGGVPMKSLTVPVAGTNTGKSLFLSDWAAFLLKNGFNVLMLSLEMGAEQLGQRIDANIMRMTTNEVANLSKTAFDKQIARLKTENLGRLVIHDMPGVSTNISHVRRLVDELMIRREFKPDIIFIDYLNILGSTRFTKFDGGTYSMMKSVSEEIRGYSMETGVPIVAPTQLNRSGQSSSDPTLENVSDSHGISMTADFMFSMVAPEELDEENQIIFTQLKNRIANRTRNKRSLIGINRDHMTLEDLDEAVPRERPVAGERSVDEDSKLAKLIITGDEPIMDKGRFHF